MDTITVFVDFPALAELVAYLRSSEQAKINELNTLVRQLTDRLNQSATALDSAAKQGE